MIFFQNFRKPFKFFIKQHFFGFGTNTFEFFGLLEKFYFRKNHLFVGWEQKVEYIWSNEKFEDETIRYCVSFPFADMLVKKFKSWKANLLPDFDNVAGVAADVSEQESAWKLFWNLEWRCTIFFYVLYFTSCTSHYLLRRPWRLHATFSTVIFFNCRFVILLLMHLSRHLRRNVY